MKGWVKRAADEMGLPRDLIAAIISRSGDGSLAALYAEHLRARSLCDAVNVAVSLNVVRRGS